MLLSLSLSLLLSSITAFAAESASEGATLQLAAHIAHSSFSDDRNTKLALLTDYETVYGSIDKVPARWPALVRRTLVCQQLANRVCVHSSLEGLKAQGGIDGLALTHLFEVSRFGMSATNIHDRLLDASEEASSKAAEPTVTAPRAEGKKASAPLAAPAPVAATVSAPAPVPEVPPAVQTEQHPATAAAAEVQSAAAPRPTAKKPHTLSERAAAKLQRLGGDDSSGYFLDALFVAVALCLILAFALYLVVRSRRAERLARKLAEQEVQRLESLRSEEKIKADHDLWSEQLKGEVALEAQKAHAEEMLRTVRTAADEALAAELLRFQMEQEEAGMAFSNELRRLQDALRAEQAKNEEVVKTAKARADQAIDAYDQMAARELVYAHKQNDDLQEVLNAEKEARKVLEMKVADALQQVEAHKQRELRLSEAIQAEQRGRASEARIATEKLKAAQQAAAALQASLAATRALNADLERRAEEAVKAAQRLAGTEQTSSGTEAAPPGVQRTL
ncbi:MAG TPA: hypothetical protein VF472_09605 [Burkholderiaceae bacterium]